MCSQLGRTGLSRISQCLTSPCSYPPPGSRSWLLSFTALQRTVSRGNNTNQSGMAGQPSPTLTTPYFHERGPGVGVDLSLQERLDELFEKENNKIRVDIGFKPVTSGEKIDREQASQWRRSTRSNKQLERAAREGTLKVDLEKVTGEWKQSGAIYQDIYKAAELYGIYEDLFRHGYFHPCVDLNIAYAIEDDMMVPVYRGNALKPREAASAPEVSWESDNDDLWTLVFTGLDSHLTEEGKEYMHWMVGNIKGCDIQSGEELTSYLQPFPPFGTGYHRYAFVLYKQDARIDFKDNPKPKDPLSLSERTFSTFEFYSEYEDRLTPAGLSFFQADYDPSLRDFFHNTLNMKEPRYEYEFPLPYIKQWNKWWNKNDGTTSGFNEFLDRRRDPKDIEKEVLIKKLKHTHPFEGETVKNMKYPLAHEEDLLEVLPEPVGAKTLNPRQSFKIPSWRRKQIILEQSKEGYYSSTDHSELRRDPPIIQ